MLGIVVAVVWVLASLVLVPLTARRRREFDVAIWIFASLLFSPLLVLLAFAAMPPAEPRQPPPRSPEEQRGA